MNEEVRTLVANEIIKSYAMCSRELPMHGIIAELAKEIVYGCKGLTVERIEPLFFAARRFRDIPTVSIMIKAWEIVTSREIESLQIKTAPIIVRRVASLIRECERMEFDDPTMGSLCLGLGMGSTWDFPNEFRLNQDRELRNAYHATKLAGRKRDHLIGFGHIKGSVIRVPSGEKYKGPLLSSDAEHRMPVSGYINEA